MNKCRKLKLIKNYTPCMTIEDEEIYRNGIFNFNISRILEDINTGKLEVEREDINTIDWYRMHFHGLTDKEHLSKVDITKPVIQAEIRPGRYEIIDGNHRLEKAYRDNIETINSYKLNGEQLVKYFIDTRGYEAFVEYWNSKL